jgi:hypothetical protein
MEPFQSLLGGYVMHGYQVRLQAKATASDSAAFLDQTLGAEYVCSRLCPLLSVCVAFVMLILRRQVCEACTGCEQLAVVCPTGADPECDACCVGHPPADADPFAERP